MKLFLKCPEYSSLCILSKINEKSEVDSFYVSYPRKGVLTERQNRWFHRENENSLVPKYSRHRCRRV